MDARAALFQQNLDLMTSYVETQTEEVLNLLLETATHNFEIFFNYFDENNHNLFDHLFNFLSAKELTDALKIFLDFFRPIFYAGFNPILYAFQFATATSASVPTILLFYLWTAFSHQCITLDEYNIFLLNAIEYSDSIKKEDELLYSAIIALAKTKFSPLLTIIQQFSADKIIKCFAALMPNAAHDKTQTAWMFSQKNIPKKENCLHLIIKTNPGILKNLLPILKNLFSGEQLNQFHLQKTQANETYLDLIESYSNKATLDLYVQHVLDYCKYPYAVLYEQAKIKHGARKLENNINGTATQLLLVLGEKKASYYKHPHIYTKVLLDSSNQEAPSGWLRKSRQLFNFKLFSPGTSCPPAAASEEKEINPPQTVLNVVSTVLDDPRQKHSPKKICTWRIARKGLV